MPSTRNGSPMASQMPPNQSLNVLPLRSKATHTPFRAVSGGLHADLGAQEPRRIRHRTGAGVPRCTAAKTDDVNKDSLYGSYFKLEGIKLLSGNDIVHVYR